MYQKDIEIKQKEGDNNDNAINNKFSNNNKSLVKIS